MLHDAVPFFDKHEEQFYFKYQKFSEVIWPEHCSKSNTILLYCTVSGTCTIYSLFVFFQEWSICIDPVTLSHLVDTGFRWQDTVFCGYGAPWGLGLGLAMGLTKLTTPGRCLEERLLA